MREFGRFPTMAWTGTTGRALRGHHLARELLCYLYSAPPANLLGLFHVSLPAMAHELGTKEREIRQALDRLIGLGLVKFDEDADLVFIPDGAALHLGATIQRADKRHKHVLSELALVGRHPFASEFAARYGAAFNLAPSEVPHGDHHQDLRGSQDAGGEGETPSPTSTPSSEGGATPSRIRPDDPYNLVHALRVAVEAAHPEIGLWNPGEWSARVARDIFDDVPEPKRPALVIQLEERIPFFVADPRAAKDGYTLKSFRRLFNTLGNGHGRDPRVGSAPPEEFTKTGERIL